MQDDFAFNSRNISRKQDQGDPNTVIAGLREAQEELESFAQEKKPTPLASPGNFESQIEIYTAKIREEKARLNELKTYIDESKEKVESRLERIQQLEGAVEKIKENLRVINEELSQGKGMSAKILREIKQKLERHSDEQRGQNT